MKIIHHQKRHPRLRLLVIAASILISFVGINAYSSQLSGSSVFAASTGSPDSAACIALDALPDEQYDNLTDQQIDDACGPEETNNPADPCDSAAYDNLSDAEYDRLCPSDGPANSSETPNTTDDTKEALPRSGPNTNQPTTQGALAISLANKTACVSSLKQFNLATIKTYGNSRIKARNDELAKLYAKYIKKKNNSKTRLKSRQTAANKKIKTTAKKAKYKLSKQDKVVVAVPASRTKNEKNDIISYKKKLNSYRSSLKKAKTQIAASQASCSVIFDSQIYSYLIPKIRSQDSIDALKFKVALYGVKAQTSSVINRINGRASASRSNNASLLQVKMNTLQTKQDLITAQAVNDAQLAKGRKYNVFRSNLQVEFREINNLMRSRP